MKKIFLLFLMLTTLILAKSIEEIDRDTREEVVKSVMKEAILEPGFIPKEVQITENSNNFLQPFNIATQCESYSDLACPPAQKGYFIRRTAADLKTGKVNCLVYNPENIDRAFANFTYINPTCKEKWTPDINAVDPSPFLQKLAQKSEQEIQILKQLKQSAQIRTKGLTDTQLNLSDLLIAAMTMDGEKIDITQSIGRGEVKLQSGYTALTEVQNAKSNAKLSDLATQVLNTRVVAIFDFMSESSETIELIVMILLLLFGVGYLLKSGVFVRIFFKSERESKGSDSTLWAIGAFVAFLFFCVPAVSLNINAEQRIHQTKFHGVLQFIFSEASKFSNTLNIFATNVTFNALLKERGSKTKEQIYQAAAENAKLEVLTQKAQAEYARCNQIFDTNNMKQFLGNFGQFTFPLSEEELHKQIIASMGVRQTYSPYHDFVRDVIQKGSSVTTSGVTFSQCGQAERAYHEGKLRIAQNLEYLTFGNTKVDEMRRNNVKNVIERQFKAISDWGFISAAFLPAVLAELELENHYITMLMDAKITENDQKNFIDKIAYNIPYLIFPGTGRIVETAIGIGSFADNVPILGGLVKAGAAVAGAMLAVDFVKVVLLIAPLLVITIVGLTLAIILFFQVLIYFISAFFAVLLAIWHNNGDNIFSFLGRGLRLFVKIVTFPASIFFALAALWFATAMGGHLSSSFADNNTIVSSFGYQIFGGVLNIIIVLVAIFASLKLVTSFADSILENLNFKQQDTLEQAIEQIQQQAARKMPTKV